MLRPAPGRLGRLVDQRWIETDLFNCSAEHLGILLEYFAILFGENTQDLDIDFAVRDTFRILILSQTEGHQHLPIWHGQPGEEGVDLFEIRLRNRYQDRR